VALLTLHNQSFPAVLAIVAEESRPATPRTVDC